jgi:ABC-type glycerol-3-phosphate transport system substrate-binding protein
MKKNYLKMFKIFLTLLISSLFSFGCGKAKNNNDGKTEIVFWHSFVSSTVPALNSLIDKFESENPSIKINAQYVPTGDALVQKLITAIQSKTAPDIAWIHSDFINKLVDADAIYKMEHFIKGTDSLSQEEMNDIFPQLLQNASYKNVLYAMPMEATVLALVYNKAHFRQAGLDPERPPQNWEELREYANKLTIDKNGDGKNDQYGFYIPAYPASGPLSIWMILQWTPFLWQAGGEEINADQTEMLFNSQAGIEALTLWKNIYDDLKFSNYSFSHDMGFASGSVSMIMDGPWDLPTFRKLKNIDWGVASLPGGLSGKATYMAGEHLSIFKQSKNPNEAWKFIKWIIGPEVQAEFSINSGYLPVRKSVLEMDSYKQFLDNDPQMRAFVEQMQIARARVNLNSFRVEINQHIAEAVERTIIGNENPKTALDNAAQKSNKLLKSVSPK